MIKKDVEVEGVGGIWERKGSVLQAEVAVE